MPFLRKLVAVQPCCLLRPVLYRVRPRLCGRAPSPLSRVSLLWTARAGVRTRLTLAAVPCGHSVHLHAGTWAGRTAAGDPGGKPTPAWPDPAAWPASPRAAPPARACTPQPCPPADSLQKLCLISGPRALPCALSVRMPVLSVFRECTCLPLQGCLCLRF